MKMFSTPIFTVRRVSNGYIVTKASPYFEPSEADEVITGSLDGADMILTSMMECARLDLLDQLRADG